MDGMTLTGDPQVQAILDEGHAYRIVADALAPLHPRTRGEVLRWASARFETSPVLVMAESPQDASRRRVEGIVDEVHEAHGMPS